MVLLEVDGDSYYQIIVLCFESLCAFVNFVIFSHLFYQLYGKHCLSSFGIIKSLNDFENEKLTVTTTKLFSTISVLFYFMTTLFLSIHHWTPTHSIYHSSILISDISWTIGQLSCYLLWITRLYWTFQGSVHQSSKFLFNSLGCLALLFALAMGSAQILLYLHSNSHIHGQHHLPYFYYVITSIFVCIIDLILSSIVMYTFLSKLRDLTAHCQRHWVGDANDYQKDRTTAKFAKAESEHFYQEKQQFRRKAKKKIRKAKKKGIVVPSNASRKGTRRTNQNRTHSRILNDIANLDPKLSMTSIESTTTTTSTFHEMEETDSNEIELAHNEDDIDDEEDEKRKEMNEAIANQMVLTVTQSTKEENANIHGQLKKETTPSSMFLSDTEPLVNPQLRNPNSLLIQNIIDNQTTITANDVASPSPFKNLKNMKDDDNNESAWNLTNNPIRFRTKKSKSVWDKPISPKTSDVSVMSTKSEANAKAHRRQTKSKSVSDTNEASITSTHFEFRVQPKLVEMERLPVANFDANAHKSSLINDDIDNRAKFSLSSVISESGSEDFDNPRMKLVPNQISVDSIYTPLDTHMIKQSSTNSNATVKRLQTPTGTGFTTPTHIATPTQKSLASPINTDALLRHQTSNSSEDTDIQTKVTLSSDFAMIDATVDHELNLKETETQDLNHMEPLGTPISSIMPVAEDGVSPLSVVTNGSNTGTPTVSAVQSSKDSKASTVTLTLGSIPQINPHKLTEIIRSPSVFDRYRENLSLDDRQRLLVVVMTKYTVLAMCAVITTQLFVIIGLVTTLLTYHQDQDDEFNGSISLDILNMVYYFIWCIDCVIGALCCYLNFKMNDKLYHRLCKCFDLKCRKICGEITKNKIVEAKIDDRAETLHQYLLKDTKQNNGKNNDQKFVD